MGWRDVNRLLGTFTRFDKQGDGNKGDIAGKRGPGSCRGGGVGWGDWGTTIKTLLTVTSQKGRNQFGKKKRPNPKGKQEVTNQKKLDKNSSGTLKKEIEGLQIPLD